MGLKINYANYYNVKIKEYDFKSNYTDCYIVSFVENQFILNDDILYIDKECLFPDYLIGNIHAINGISYDVRYDIVSFYVSNNIEFDWFNNVYYHSNINSESKIITVDLAYNNNNNKNDMRKFCIYRFSRRYIFILSSLDMVNILIKINNKFFKELLKDRLNANKSFIKLL